MSQNSINVDLILKRLAEHTEEAKSRVKRASEVLLGPLETDLATTPYEVVYEEDRVRLKYYRPETITHKVPLLLVYALINRETRLDLQPGRSVVQSFLNHGMEIYMVDWGYPTRKDQFVTIADHVSGYMNNIVDFIRHRHGIQKINLMGICMGGAFSVMYSSLNPEKIQNLVTTVTPTHFETDTGLLHIWMRSTRAMEMGKAYGNMPGDLMNLGFLMLNPARLIIDKYIGFLENMDDRDFVENFVRMEKWIFDSPDVPAATFKQFIEDCYGKNLLIQSKLELDGRRVDLKKLTMPLLNIYGKFDHLVPPEACNKLTSTVGSTDVEDICLNTGHIGIYVSSKCQELFAPKIAAWLKAREAPIPLKKRNAPARLTSSARGADITEQSVAAAQMRASGAEKPRAQAKNTSKKTKSARAAGPKKKIVDPEKTHAPQQ